MSLLSYSAITTKIRAMENKLFTENNFTEIASLESIPEFIEYLKKSKGYGDSFAPVDDASIHRGQIERLLSSGKYIDFAKIYKFANVKQRKFMDLYFMRYEIVVLKSCLRMAFDKKTIRIDLSIFKEFFDSHSDIDIDKVSTSATLSEFLENLKGSKYYEPISKLDNVSEPTLFDYEMQLDLFYFSTIWKNRKKCLKGEDLDIITEIYGTRIDMVNIQWIYRSKKYHKLTPSQIYALILPYNYKLRKHQLSTLVEASDLTEFATAYKATCYGGMDYNERVSLEDLHRRVQIQLAKSTSRKHPYSMATVNAYLYNKELEIKKLTSALECIRYKLSPADSLSYIMK